MSSQIPLSELREQILDTQKRSWFLNAVQKYVKDYYPEEIVLITILSYLDEQNLLPPMSCFTGDPGRANFKDLREHSSYLHYAVIFLLKHSRAYRDAWQVLEVYEANEQTY